MHFLCFYIRYELQAKNISEEMKALADEMQYYKALQINARHKNDQILDLHGLKINGAMRVLKEFLQVLRIYDTSLYRLCSPQDSWFVKIYVFHRCSIKKMSSVGLERPR